MEKNQNYNLLRMLCDAHGCRPVARMDDETYLDHLHNCMEYSALRDCPIWHQIIAHLARECDII